MKNKRQLLISLGRYFVYVILIMATVLTCTACSDTRKKSESKTTVETVTEKTEKKQEKEPLLIFTIGFSSVVQDYTSAYPNEEIEVVQINENNLDKDYNDALFKYGEPDLIIDSDARGIRYWVERGYAADISVYFDTDVTFDSNAYYPGLDSVGSVHGALYGLPLGLRVNYLTVREEVWEESEFSKLPENYSALELLYAMEEELDKWMAKEPEEWKLVFGNGTPYPILDYLWSSGAIEIVGDEVQLDREIFETVVQGYIKSTTNISDYSGKVGYFTSLTNPSDGNARYIVTSWDNGVAPQVGLVYHQSANQTLLNQQIRVLWHPVQPIEEDAAAQYAAGVAVWGMVGRNSERAEEAYTVLRKMMDVPAKVYIQIGVGFSESIPFPVNRQQALDMITWVEEEYVDTFTLYSEDISQIQKQPLSDELRTEMEYLLQNISFVYAIDRTAESDVYNGINPYFYDNITDMDLLYNNTLEALQIYAE